MQSNAEMLRIPYPPSANRLWRFYRSRPTKSKEYQIWLEQCSLVIKMTWRKPTITMPVHVDLLVGVPDQRTRDLDNRIKPCLDLLQRSQVIEDDSLVHSLSARWYSKLKSEVCINIKTLT